jgi:hypothetical protein
LDELANGACLHQVIAANKPLVSAGSSKVLRRPFSVSISVSAAKYQQQISISNQSVSAAKCCAAPSASVSVRLY